jgi:membrane protein
VPNTKVHFKGALLAGVLAGTLFQVVQWLFVSGQVYVSKYNAIYGSFAFLPLLLVWLQLSWLLTLAGVVLTYAWQNFDNFAFRDKAKGISQTYSNNLAIAVLTMAIKRFKRQEGPLSHREIIRDLDIPAQLADKLLNNLLLAGLLSKVNYNEDKDDDWAIQPAFDPDDFTVNNVANRLADIGTSTFIPKADTRFAELGACITRLREKQQGAVADIRLLDLP